MSFIRSIGTALPAHYYPQEEILKVGEDLYRSFLKKPEDLETVFENAKVRHRYFIQPIEKILTLQSFVERNRIFFEEGLKLAQKAIENCLEESGVSPKEIDSILFVSSTGFSVPSLDVHLINRLGFSPSTKRCSIFGWGCFGGVAGLTKAAEYVKVYPRERVLLINLELCTLAYQSNDHSLKALIATILFNDAATAVLIEGEEIASKKNFGPRLLKGKSLLFPETSHLMGWEHRESGLQVVLSPEIPEVVRKNAKRFVDLFLSDYRMSLKDFKMILSHTGGAKILQALEEGLNSHPQQTSLSWQTLEDVGNVSSCSILFTLKKAIQKENFPGERALLLAFGPGFSAEGALIEW